MPKISDWVKESVSGTPGTGTITLGGAVTGFCRFQDAFVTTDKVIYTVEDGNNKEIGIGTLTTGAPWTLARTTVLKTIDAGTYDDTSPSALTLTSAAIVGIAATSEGAGIVVGSARSSTSASVTCNTALPIDDTIPQNTEGTEVLTVAYTPKFSDSIIRIKAEAWGATSTNAGVACALFVDSTANALAADSQYSPPSTNSQYHRMGIEYEEVSGNTTSRTYKFRIGLESAGSFYINSNAAGARRFGGVSNAFISVTELRQ